MVPGTDMDEAKENDYFLYEAVGFPQTVSVHEPTLRDGLLVDPWRVICFCL